MGKVADIRNHFLQQTSTAISKTQATVVVEDLKVRNMSKSAAGTKENPGSPFKMLLSKRLPPLLKSGASGAS